MSLSPETEILALAALLQPAMRCRCGHHATRMSQLDGEPRCDACPLPNYVVERTDIPLRDLPNAQLARRHRLLLTGEGPTQ